MARFTKTFPAPRGVREFQSITIQEVTGEEEIQAGMLADAHKGKSGREWSPLIEMVKLSIVSYTFEGNIQNVTAPFDAFDKWSSRARNAVMAFYNDVNGLDEQDLKACVAAATAAGQTPKTTPTKDEAPTVAPSGG